MTLEETLKQIKPLNEEKMKTARRRWDSIAKPLHSLGTVSYTHLTLPTKLEV